MNDKDSIRGVLQLDVVAEDRICSLVALLVGTHREQSVALIDNYNMLASKGMLMKDAEGKVHDVTTWVGDAGMFDVSNPATREWLWSRYKTLTEDGVEGWWGDLGEPEVHPLTMWHHNGESAAQYHNVYGNEWSRIIYEGFKKEFPNKRLMLLMRGGTAGLQRYNVFPWSTDVSRLWGGLQPQVKIMLNSSLSGLAYMSSDIGGFAVDPANPLDAELYVRWLQMGAFTPTFRTHAQLKPEQVAAIDGVDLVLGAEQKGQILEYIAQRLAMMPEERALVAHEHHTVRTADIRTFMPSCSCGDRTRYFLKVQDGCDYYCTCIFHHRTINSKISISH